MNPRCERMSAVDAAWLSMDTPENRMIITSLLEFDDPPRPRDLDGVLEKLAALPRFRRRVVAPSSPLQLPSWEEDPRFDLRAHVRHVGLPAPGGAKELQAFVGERMGAALDPQKPLWEMDVIDRPGSGPALLLRVHHCVGDGVALVRMLLGLAEGGAPAPRIVGRPPEPSLAPLDWIREQMVRARTLVELTLLPPDPATPLRTALGLVKRAAWSDPIPLAAVQDLAKAEGATVNDVLMAALAGALREALERTNAAPLRDVRAMVPLYLRGPEAGMGNHFGLVYVTLPITEKTREARLHRFKERMALVKASPTAPVAFEVLRAFGAAGAAAERLGVALFTAKASVMVTNVPGPQGQVRLAGKPISSMMTWAPMSGALALSATLLSYAGEVRLGVYADAHLPIHPADLVRGFERELGAATMLSAQPPAAS